MENLDLFGDVVVTLEDVELWLDAVPQLPRDSPRRRHYAQNWDVSNKIRSSKIDGQFDLIINNHLSRLESHNCGGSNVRDLYTPKYR